MGENEWSPSLRLPSLVHGQLPEKAFRAALLTLLCFPLERRGNGVVEEAGSSSSIKRGMTDFM